MKKAALFLFLSVFFSQALSAATQTTPYDKEQVKQDYRAFLQQLKALNAQYKEITGEIGQVMKEEGVPSWDMGDAAKGLDGINKEEDSKKNLQDLGGGAYLKETDSQMQLTLDLPGFKRDSIKLSFQDGKKLLINAQRTLDGATRSYERAFDLPVPGDPKGTSAAYEDGVLTVKVPKGASKEVVIPVK